MEKETHLIAQRCRAVLTAAGVFLFAVLPSPLLPAEKAKVSNPAKFKVNLSLPRVGEAARAPAGVSGAKGFSSSGGIEAGIAVNILDSRFYPVKTFLLKSVKNPEKIASLWDGRDVYGKEMPAGDYYASLSITYSDGTKESKFFKFTKE